jgi:uncharacterized iron-regulated membrane protein
VWAYRMWWQRRPTRVDRRRPLGDPPARGTWRSLPPVLLIVGIPAVIALGWAIPLLGWSLLGFLVIGSSWVWQRAGARHACLPVDQGKRGRGEVTENCCACGGVRRRS